MKNLYKIVFAFLFLLITYIIVDTSYQSNLFIELKNLLEIPWMVATLYDFYINMFIIILWMAYREQRVLNIIIWSILFVTTGAIATTVYVLVQIFKLKENETFGNIFIRKPVN